jgi:PAS domain S-box-containing protein
MGSGLRGWRILHIDDDEEDFILVRAMLSQAQSVRISLDWASSLTAGREKLLANTYDAVLVDYDLGVVTGIELIREMVARDYAAPLILYTGRGSYEVDVEAMQAGATMYLSKSESTPLLLERIIRYAIERKQAELAQVEIQDRFRAVLEYSMDVAYRRNLLIDCYDYISPVVERVLGFTPIEMDQMSITEVLERIHPDDRAGVEAAMQLSECAGSAQLEYRFLRKDGQYRWMADYVTVQFDRDGRAIYRVGNLRDIHESKKIEEEVRANEAKFRQMFSVGAIGVQLWEESGGLSEVNDAFLQLVGYTRQDFEAGSINWRALTAPEYRHLDDLSTRQMRAGELPTPYEKELIRKDGRRVPVLIAVNRLGESPTGSLTGVAYFFDMSEQHRALNALRESEERFRLSTKAVSGLMYDWNLVTGDNYHSEGVEPLLGVSNTTSTIVNWWLEDMHPDDLPRIQTELREVLESDRGIYELEYRMRHADGHWVHVWDRAVVERDAEGNAVRIVGFATDFTERQQLLEANQRQNDLLQRVMSTTPMAIALLQGPEFRYLYANAAYERIARGKGDLFGRALAEVWPEASDVLLPNLQHVLETGNTFLSHEYTVPVDRESGLVPATFDVAFSPVFDPEGRVEAIILQAIEITEEVLARQAAQAEQALLNAVLDQMLSGVAIAEAPSGRILRRNESLRKLLNNQINVIENVEDYGKWTAFRADGTRLNAEDWPLARSIQKGEVVQGDEITMHFPDGAQSTLSIRSTPIMNPDGRIVAAVATLEDISERKKAEANLHHYMEQLQRSNQDLQDFAFTVSHDLHEPLRKVQAFGNLLVTSSGPELSEEQRDYIYRMQQASERMRLMIEGMLRYSRVTTQAEPFQPVDLAAVMNEVLLDFELRITQTGAQVEVEPLPLIEADPVQMRQLLQNLFENALKYARPGTRPVVRVSSQSLPDDQVAIQVKDNGIGIEQRYIPSLFKPFRRLHSSAEIEGTGMGLAIVRKIAERHSGSIQVESQPGIGSTFIIVLPVKHH